jgi:hypothetical protein
MVLEGFGASLIGRAVYVVADPEHAWLPNEYISGIAYSCRILISGDGPGLRLIQAQNTWNAIFHPVGRDWSTIATMIRAGVSSGPVLLTIDTHAPALPPVFVNFLDGILAEGRTLTRVWIGTHHEIPAIPDAILFPPLRDHSRATAAYEMMRRLPGRDGHATWTTMSPTEWSSLVEATAKSDLGILISDVGEREWTLFWHKIDDSLSDSHDVLMKCGLVWLRTGAAMLENSTSK